VAAAGLAYCLARAVPGISYKFILIILQLLGTVAKMMK